MEIVRPSQWVTQTWRNGGGTTHEIHREGAADAFTFRLSIAEVERPGPFSRYPGIDRWIALLEGKGFVLHRGELSRTIDLPLVAFRFSGDDAVDCTLVDGPVRDLNVMAARDAITLDVKSISILDASTFTPPAGATRSYVFGLGGELTVNDAPLALHELRIDDAAEVTVGGRGDVLLVWSTPKQGAAQSG